MKFVFFKFVLLLLVCFTSSLLADSLEAEEINTASSDDGAQVLYCSSQKNEKYAPCNLIDGSNSKVWSTCYKPDFNQKIILQLSRPTKLSSIKICTKNIRSKYKPGKIKIYASESYMSAFEKLLSVKLNKNKTKQTVNLPAVDKYYSFVKIKIKSTQKSKKYCKISEIKVYGEALSSSGGGSGSGEDPDYMFYPGDYSAEGVIGNSLPGTWRPFTDDSPWNTPIAADAVKHPDSSLIMSTICSQAGNVRFSQQYSIPVWVVNSANVSNKIVESNRIFATWDQNDDGLSDVGVPLKQTMWQEPSSDGHICIIDPFTRTSYEMSRFQWSSDGTPECTTFNIWDITEKGYGDPYYDGWRWQTRGGRGSGFPIIAGLLRPEELTAGEIRHALVFTFNYNRRANDNSDIFLPPACRSDGWCYGNEYPIEGMLFQLDPNLTEADFDAMGLNREGKIIARALQKYGMYLGDNGGAMALQLQILGPSESEHMAAWEQLFPGLFNNVKKIPANKFKVIYTGEPIKKYSY